MYLKALEIQGFKSFPDKTVLNFGEDITAIVGPNGSGKSNISDAIRWVMGEQNSRQLRGAKMEDVIFGGTEKRSQMGFAQVTLVIDNTEHIFPRDEAEVAVTRRYYRSGESEYYINKQSVRLKDVNELFMDTGMGREGYSIIGQGKIDEILSVKSGERREVFEEAAGISKYRHRKEEAERKLERTQENLVRINDKIAELELQVEPLRKQAEVAKKYLVLRDELRVLEISVWLEQLQDLKTAKFKLQTDVESARADKERAEAALEAAYAAAEELSEQVRRNDLEAETLRGQVSQLEAAGGEHDSAIAVLHTSVEHNNESIARIQREMEDTENRAGSLQSQVDAQLERIGQIDQESAALAQELDGLLAKARELTDTAAGAARTAESLRAEEALLLSAAADGKAELSALRSGMSQMDERREHTAGELTAAQEKLERSGKESRENRKLLNAAREEAQAVSNIIQGHSLKMEGRKKRSADAEAEKLQLTMDAAALENRIRLLTEMEKEYEGFSNAVKLVMQAAEKKALRGIHGPVASLIKTQEKYTVALEIALGAGMQNIVVDREEDGKAAIGYLKQRNGGRATFLPMTAVRGDTLRENVSSEYGFVGLAVDLIEYDRQYDGIFKSLLGRTVVVEDLDCGIAMARKYRNSFRIVTLDGQVMNRGGSMTGGSVSRSAGVLSRANELEKLNGQLGGMRDRLSAANRQAESDIAAHQAQLDSLRQQGTQLREKLSELSAQKLQLEGQRDAKNRESRECNDAVIATTQELSRMEQKLQSNAMEETALLDKLWERYELSHSAALEQRVELESVPKATRRIAELNREIKGLGTPNIGAIDEYERVNTRYTYLSEQRADVEKAREELLGVIEELTKQMTAIFAQQFKLLNESFQETFLELFGGGKAQLELEDEKDILNCGIEIRVQPPGKQLKTITLLSGGEKAFVAIALYFAILKVHPTPFCVMDEIEAALDESNVVRYARYMRRIAGKTQFIVITHRRGTMEEADVLYGVTMQERGVSRILTINMNDMAKELNIK